MILAHAEAVHISRPLDGKLGDHPLFAVVADPAQPIEALHAEIGDVIVMAGALRIVMRVRGGDLTAQSPAIAEHAKRLERVGREAHRYRGLGECDDFARIAGDVDAAIVGELRIEDRGDAAEQRAAGIGGELGVGDLAGRLGRAEGFALEEAVRVGHAAVGERESVQHRQPVKPVIIGAGTHLELGWSGAKQRAFQP